LTKVNRAAGNSLEPGKDIFHSDLPFEAFDQLESILMETSYPFDGYFLNQSRERSISWAASRYMLLCFALRTTTEEQRPDGTSRLASGKHALRVTLNR
jgi:hypothetical protein